MAINKWILLSLLAAPLLPAQTAPVWFKVVPENGTATLPAGATYQYGATGKFCDPIVVTSSTPPIVASNSSIPCTVKGVKTADPDPNVVKELDVQEQAASFVVPVVINGVKSNVTVPALPAPPPPPASTTQTLSCTATAIVTVTTPTSGTPVVITSPLNFTCTPVAQ